MKISSIKIIILLTALGWLQQRLLSSNLDGTLGIVYKTEPHVFHNGESARGYVRLNSGFTVVPGALATLDTVISISGSIDLRDTGQLQLLKDLVLDSNATWSSGGYINGRGKALVLNGNLSIPSSKTIHISGDTIIDGRGNTLLFNDCAQIFIDNNITLTLRNLVIRNTKNSVTSPCLRVGGNGGKIAFDNTVLAMKNDLKVAQGQLYFHNDVVFTGTSGLVYNSTAPSYIASGGRLLFDAGSSFSFAPTTTTEKLFVLQDQTSTLHLNACTLNTTASGMRLTKGRLVFENKVVLNTNTTGISGTLSTISTLTSTGYSSANGINWIDWTPDGNILIITGEKPENGQGGFNNRDNIRLYQFNGSTLTTVTSSPYGDRVVGASWSPDGKFLAVGGNGAAAVGGFANTDQLRIYSFDGANLTPVTSQPYGGASGIVTFVEWSPDGSVLAIGGTMPSPSGGFADSNELRLYNFNGVSLTALTSQDYGITIEWLGWHPSGNFLAIAGIGPASTGGFANTDELRIYSFNGSTLTALTSQAYSGGLNTLRWSRDGNFLAIGGLITAPSGGFANSNEVRVYSFNGTSLSAVASQDYGTNASTSIFAVDWSPDGTLLAVGGMLPDAVGGFPGTDELRVYTFNGSTLTPSVSKAYGNGNIANFIDGLIWHPNGSVLAISGKDPINPSGGFNNTDEIRLYTPNYTSTSSPQATSRSLIFGNSSEGSSSNLNVEILGAAHITINGTINDDSV